jgi:hypothetical protein
MSVPPSKPSVNLTKEAAKDRMAAIEKDLLKKYVPNKGWFQGKSLTSQQMTNLRARTNSDEIKALLAEWDTLAGKMNSLPSSKPISSGTTWKTPNAIGLWGNGTTGLSGLAAAMMRGGKTRNTRRRNVKKVKKTRKHVRR